MELGLGRESFGEGGGGGGGGDDEQIQKFWLDYDFDFGSASPKGISSLVVP